jgi:hypothetical protein
VISVGFGAYPYAYYGGCRRWRLVATPYGWQYRLVNVCYYPSVYYGGYYGPYGVYY